MIAITEIPVLLFANEACWCELTWSRAAGHVEVQEPVEDHAETDSSAFEPVLEAIVLCLHVVPLLWLGGVPARDKVL